MSYPEGLQSGVLAIDKPENMSSAQVVSRLKRWIHARKVGHAGTLDPFATGVLVCCVNQATRIARFLLNGTKIYEAQLQLGITTDTQDATGSVTAQSSRVDVPEVQIHAAFKHFEGVIEQLPPAFSALKHRGVPLYRLARKGTPIQKPPRRVQIYYNKILRIEKPFIRFEVACSAGTYIRTLCADIGTFLGCGAHLKALRRIESSGFKIADTLSMHETEALSRSGNWPERLVSMTEALDDIPSHTADNTLTRKIRYGNILTQIDIRLPAGCSSGPIKVVEPSGRLLAVLNYEEKAMRYGYCCVFSN